MLNLILANFPKFEGLVFSNRGKGAVERLDISRSDAVICGESRKVYLLLGDVTVGHDIYDIDIGEKALSLL